MPTLESQLDAAYARVKETVLRKNADYGDAWRKHGTVGILVRLSDKSLRLQNLDGKQALVVEEDTLLDIAGYALLGMTEAGHETE